MPFLAKIVSHTSDTLMLFMSVGAAIDEALQTNGFTGNLENGWTLWQAKRRNK
jgi:hypothetical protein